MVYNLLGGWDRMDGWMTRTDIGVYGEVYVDIAEKRHVERADRRRREGERKIMTLNKKG